VTAGPRPLAPGAALYECRITHTRLAPLRHAFTYRTYQWLVDLDHLPRLGPGLRLPSFVATVHGTGRPATARALLGAAARHPCSTVAVSARIRWQGIRLYLRGLPVVPRPPHQPQEGVQ
jgi:DUF1365 family protein